MSTADPSQATGSFASEDVEAHVRQHAPGYTVMGTPVQVTGGLLNNVWRVPAEPTGLIVKHAPPFIASAPDVPLDPTRLMFEERALQAVGESGCLSDVRTAFVRAPRLVDMDADRSVLIMQDVGAVPHLGEVLGQLRTGSRFGANLGTFIGRLHGASQGRADVADRFRNLPIQKTRLAIQYEAIAALLREVGVEDAHALGTRAAQLGEQFLVPGRCLIHGDLWPRSVLVGGKRLYLIDWEFAHFGSPAQDLGHLAAHLWMHHHRAASPDIGREARRCWRHFADGYRTALGASLATLISPNVLRATAIHAGAEILVRAIGSFKGGYLYDGAEDVVVAEAVHTAAAWLRHPDDCELVQRVDRPSD